MVTPEYIDGAGSYSSQYRITKVGKIVSIYLYNIITSSLNKDITVMTLPAGCRPARNIIVCGATQSGQLQALNNAQFYIISTARQIKTYTYNAINGKRLFATFITP